MANPWRASQRRQARFNPTVQSKQPPPTTSTSLLVEKEVYAFFAAWTPLCTRSDRCFFATMTTKRWKSVNDLRFSAAARFCAHADFSHFSTTASASTCFFTTPEPAARGSLVRRMPVRERCLKG